MKVDRLARIAAITGLGLARLPSKAYGNAVFYVISQGIEELMIHAVILLRSSRL
jgi:hypothetical protein